MAITSVSSSTSSILTQHDMLLLSVIFLASFYVTNKTIPKAMETMRERGIFGIDINKVTLADRRKFGECKQGHKPFPDAIKKHIVPESAGTSVGLVYLCSIAAAFVLLPGCPHDRCNAALCSMAFALLLGFVDDVLDVRWRYKILFSAFTTLPLLNSYSGPLWIAVPIQLRSVVSQWLSPLPPSAGVSSTAVTDLASAVEVSKRYIAPYLFATGAGGTAAEGGAADTPGLYLGPLYLMYMALVCIFCTNSINILAGVNGVEVGQTMVICVAQIIHNLLSIYLYSSNSKSTSTSSTSSTSLADINSANHRVSLIILVPFLACCLALWRYNRYPSRVFVGDSFTYMAGVVLAVAGITGVYSKTLLLFFFPQLLNFVVSLPQLFGIVKCPRHRVPTYKPQDGLLHNSGNYTVLNMILACTRPLKEGTLTTFMLLFQASCCGIALWIRHSVAAHFFEVVN